MQEITSYIWHAEGPLEYRRDLVSCSYQKLLFVRPTGCGVYVTHTSIIRQDVYWQLHQGDERTEASKGEADKKYNSQKPPSCNLAVQQRHPVRINRKRVFKIL